MNAMLTLMPVAERSAADARLSAAPDVLLSMMGSCELGSTVVMFWMGNAGEQLGGCTTGTGGGCPGLESQQGKSSGEQDTAGQLQESLGLLPVCLLPLQVCHPAMQNCSTWHKSVRQENQSTSILFNEKSCAKPDHPHGTRLSGLW